MPEATIVFSQWKESGSLSRWHQFQDVNRMIGNCYWWWHSRWCDDHPVNLKNIKGGDNHYKQKMFNCIWKTYQQEFTRLEFVLVEEEKEINEDRAIDRWVERHAYL